MVWSEQQERLLGLAPGAFRGSYEQWRGMLHPEDVVRAEQETLDAIEEKRDVENEFRVIRPDGEVRWLMTRGRIFYDEQGQPQRMLGVNEDVTERRQAEEALRVAHHE